MADANPLISVIVPVYNVAEYLPECVDSIVSWKEHMESMIKRYGLKKIKAIISGGKDRQESVLNGLHYIQSQGVADDDVVIIHDGVRPLIQENILSENIRVAKKYGNAMTVRPVIESVVITNNDEAGFDAFKKRDDT